MRHVLIAAVALVAAAAGPPAATTLAVPGRTNATPSIAAAGQFVALVWGATTSAGATDVYAAVSRDGGRTFGTTARVNDVSGNASLGAEQPPRVALVARPGRDPELVVIWTAKSKDGTRLLAARSADSGASFAHATPIAGSQAAGNRGWESTAVDRDGHVVALWLDHRETASSGGSPMNHDGHDHSKMSATKADGVERAQLSKLYFARVDDPAGTKAVTGGVCYCCKTAVSVGPDGAIYAAWRHVYPGNVRDIAFTRSRDGGRTFAPPSRVSNDQWMLDGCPENGPALAIGADNTVHIVWPTLVPAAAPDGEPTPALFYAAARDGRTFSPRQRIVTDGVPRHAQLIAVDRTLVSAWDEEADGGARRVVLARATSSAPSGAIRFSREIVSGTARAQTPSVAAVADGTVIAWAEGADQSVIRVERRP